MRNLFTTIIILLFFKLNAQNTFPDSGNVGIGTRNPDSKLTVVGNVNIGGNNDRSLKVRHINGKKSNSTEHDNLFLNYATEKPVWIGSAANPAPLIVNGNIGIGTTNPLEKLHINGNLKMDIGEGFKILGDLNYFGKYHDGIIFQMEDRNASNGKTDGGFIFRGYTTKDNISKEWMVIKNGGRVGIGTTNPDAKLAVNGDIHTKEVKVDLNGWADFVFTKGYDLPSLEEVENYINKKGHLADIPSAKEVAKNGVKLGEINKKLLQKIEELTLYTIQQEKRLKKQDSRLEKLEKLLKNQSEIINQLKK